LEDILKGGIMGRGEFTRRKKTCPGCGGIGVQHNTKTGLTETCPVCHGSGEVPAGFGKERKKFDEIYKSTSRLSP
jgi:DnaJ-class molecular chaperone